MTKKEHNKLLARSIKTISKSLVSHLYWSYENDGAGTKFHQDCVREYAKVLLDLSKLWK